MPIPRDKKIDIAKAIGIILVVLGHAGMPHSSFIFRFHMALFFALSGWCFSDRNVVSFKALIVYIKNKVLKLYVPFVLFNLFSVLARNMLIGLNVYTDNKLFLENSYGGNSYGLTMPLSFNEMKPYIRNILFFSGESQLGGATWFLRVLFGITVLWASVHFLLKTLAKFNDKMIITIDIVISVFSLWLAYNLINSGASVHFQFQTVLAVYPIYSIGYYLKRCYLKTSFIQDITLFVLSFVILHYCDYRCNINGWNSNVNLFDNPFMYLTSSVTGIIMIISISSVISRIKISNSLCLLGKHTLAVLIWHFLCFKVVTWIQCLLWNAPSYRIASFPVMKSGGGWWIAYSVAGTLLPLVISIIYSKIKTQTISVWKNKKGVSNG